MTTDELSTLAKEIKQEHPLVSAAIHLAISVELAGLEDTFADQLKAIGEENLRTILDMKRKRDRASNN